MHQAPALRWPTPMIEVVDQYDVAAFGGREHIVKHYASGAVRTLCGRYFAEVGKTSKLGRNMCPACVRAARRLHVIAREYDSSLLDDPEFLDEEDV